MPSNLNLVNPLLFQNLLLINESIVLIHVNKFERCGFMLVNIFQVLSSKYTDAKSVLCGSFTTQSTIFQSCWDIFQGKLVCSIED